VQQDKKKKKCGRSELARETCSFTGEKVGDLQKVGEGIGGVKKNGGGSQQQRVKSGGTT